VTTAIITDYVKAIREIEKEEKRKRKRKKRGKAVLSKAAGSVMAE
jgi:hypothetical protein